MNIGLAIKKCRKLRDLTLAELAHKVHLSRSYLSLVENGKRNPSLGVLNDISTTINIPLHLLVYIGAERNEITEMDENIQKILKDLIFGLFK